MGLVYLVQHAEKRSGDPDPGLTALGHEQARAAARFLSRVEVTEVVSSPLRRARETAEPIARAVGTDVRADDRLRERMNWDGQQPMDEFLADWARSVRDRDYVPGSGDSSDHAAARLIEFLRERETEPGVVAAVTHGGVTADLLRTLLGDDSIDHALIERGVPSCAITTLRGLTVLDVAVTAHLD